MFELLSKGWNALFGSATVDPGDSTLLGSDGFITRAWDNVTDFLGSDAGKATAKFASTALFGKSGMPQFGTPKAKTISAPRNAASSQMAEAGKADMGMTARAEHGARVAATNAIQGSPIQVTIQKIQNRQTRGPLLRLENSQIQVASRAKSK